MDDVSILWVCLDGVTEMRSSLGGTADIDSTVRILANPWNCLARAGPVPGEE